MDENDKQEPTLNDQLPPAGTPLPDPAAQPDPGQTPGPDANKEAVQDNTQVTIEAPGLVPMTAVTGHPTDGDHGRRMIFGYDGAGSHGAVIDHGASRTLGGPGKIEAFGVRFKGVESNFFDAVTETKAFQTLREAEQWVRSFVNSHLKTDTTKTENSNG